MKVDFIPKERLDHLPAWSPRTIVLGLPSMSEESPSMASTKNRHSGQALAENKGVDGGSRKEGTKAVQPHFTLAMFGPA